MDKKVGKLVQDIMGKGEKVAPVKKMKLSVKFQKPEDMETNKKKVLKKAVKKAEKEEKGEDPKEEKGESKAEEDAEEGEEGTGKGGPSKKYKNLGKKSY